MNAALRYQGREVPGFGLGDPNQSFIDATTELALATAIYAILVDASSGAPNSLLVISGNSQPGWTYPNIQAAQQYNAQMNQVMQLCEQAAQNAVDVIQQAAASNPNATSYLGGAQNDLSVIQSWSKRVAQSVTGGPYDVPSNWYNCAEQQQGNSITGSTYNFQCYPDVTWLELTYGVVSFAQQAVGFAHDALGIPRPPPPPPTPPCPKGQVRVNGKCIMLMPIRTCPPGTKFDVQAYLKNPAGGGCVPKVTVTYQGRAVRGFAPLGAPIRKLSGGSGGVDVCATCISALQSIQARPQAAAALAAQALATLDSSCNVARRLLP